MRSPVLAERKNANKVLGDTKDTLGVTAPPPPIPRKTDFPCRVSLLASSVASPVCKIPADVSKDSMYPVTFPGTFIHSFSHNTASTLSGPKSQGICANGVFGKTCVPS